METKVKFVACDMPEATPFMLHIYAAVAEQEARAISARTKVALQAAKQRGVRLGRTGAEILAPKYRAEALDRKQLEPVIREMQNAGYSIRRMATELTNRKVKTPRGGDWHPQTVKNSSLFLGVFQCADKTSPNVREGKPGGKKVDDAPASLPARPCSRLLS
jgi:DNA invertase Pin-like site-specific DNA recombinase